MTSDIAKRQRTVPSAKAFEYNWRRSVPEALLRGETFDRFEEETGAYEPGCFVKVDDDGFFLAWKSDANEGQVLELSQVSDVRQGFKPKDEKLLGMLQERFPGKPLDDLIITICSGLDLVNLTYTNMVASDPETATLWINSLRDQTHNIKANNVCPMTQLRKHWLRLELTVNARGKVPVKVITKTFASGRNERIIFQSLKDLDLPNGKNDEVEPADFTFEKFYELYHKICPRTDIEDLFKSISTNGKDLLTDDQMITFLNETQRDPRLNEILYPFANKQTIKYIQENYEVQEEVKTTDCISIECFYRYLMSDDNAPVFLDRLDIYQDMEQPTSHYYINSSHNTYLTGRQFGGKSSVEMYRQVLLAGCRCIELDCWDGKGEDQEPIITHGKAMCTDILFKDVIIAIRETAFVTSDAPIIMSFENHCSKHQQYKLAKYCEDVLGDFLLQKFIEGHPLEPGVALPSPEKLKRKILIKNKRLKPDVEKHQLDLFMGGQPDAIAEENEIAEDPDAVVDGEAGPMINDLENTPRSQTVADLIAHPENAVKDTAAGKEPGTPAAPVARIGAVGKLSDAEMKRLLVKKEEGTLTPEEEQSMLSQYHYTGATTSIHPVLSAMVNYAQPVKFQGFDIAEDCNSHFHMSSFNENVALGLIKKDCIGFVGYNKRQMSRIYPRGNRVDSSNYMPQIFWNAGCQMVALNFQTPDLAMQLNQGKFEYNGNCGFLLKPEFMRRPERQFDPFSESPMDGVIAATCEVRVISGQFLSDRKIGTYVEVDMYGLPTDTIRKEFRTRVVPNNGLNPVYGDDAVFVFRKIVLPDLAVLRIAVYEDTGKLIGQRVLPLDGLQTGYRHISLRTEGNFPLSLPTLFCKVSMSTYVPEGLNDLVDALSDPRAFLSKEEQRMKQLQSMGIDSSEIADVPSNKNAMKKPLKANANQAGTGDANSAKKDEKKDDPKFDNISLPMLMSDKTLRSLVKKQAKELETLKKKHEKESTAMMRQQATVIDRLQASSSSGTKQSSKRNGSAGQNSNSVSLPIDDETRNRISEVVSQHTDQWGQIQGNHRREVHEMCLAFIDARRELLVKVMKTVQETQKRDLKLVHERDVKDMKAQQAKVSVDAKNTVTNDKKLKNKAERDRRIRELKDYNTKRFIDQRKAQAQKHDRQNQEVIKRHAREEEEVLNGLNREKDDLIRQYNEELKSTKKATVI